MLRQLSLNSNLINRLPSGIFNSLQSLNILYLNNNHLRYLWQIRELQPGIFNNLPALHYLYLENN